jgi:methyl-accepting chemotaxis protein
MGALPSLAQSEFRENSLPVKKRLVEVLSINPADLKYDRSQGQREGLGRRVSVALNRLLITFYICVAATLAWLSYGDAAREAIASSFPRLGWLAWRAAPVGQMTPDTVVSSPFSPDQPQAMSLNLDAVWERIDQLSASQEQIAHSIEQLTASREQLIREISELRAIEQYILYKNSEPQPQRATAAPKRSTQLAR